MRKRTPETEQEEQAKIEWLRAAAKEGFDGIERGDSVTLRSSKDIKDLMVRLGAEAAAEFAVKQKKRA
jgi:hypothetical protein